ncbi:FG-GAP-like repeat-containing protein [Streptomyces atroolivaceus]|uniref:FG-GAP-like repeat-containing protein n=1 Tax=Streptomyces atroolivaceus TaxID=66869 RepID=UPI0036456CD2
MAGKPAVKTTATIGRNDLTTAGGHVSEIVDLVPRPGRDLVMARLATPVTGITPVTISTEPVAADETLTVPGYGRTKTEWVPDKLHTSTFTVNSTTDTSLDITGKTTDDAICKGDAGAPLLREANGKLEVVGVSSRSWQGGCFGETETRNDAIAARADNTVLGSRLTPGQRLLPGDALASASAKLTMQTDGNLVIQSNASKTLWSTGTTGNAGATASLDTAGNLTVRDAADTVTLWEAKTSAPGGSAVLYDRGNLVVLDAQAQSVWSSGTAIRHDYNGDGRSDMAVWYNYTDGRDAIHSFLGGTDGAISKPFTSYDVADGVWDTKTMKYITGDFNGDGRDDLSVFYGQGDDTVKTYVFPAAPNGGFAAPAAWWQSASLDWNRTTPHAGDFNGDGRDDALVWYVAAPVDHLRVTQQIRQQKCPVSRVPW